MSASIIPIPKEVKVFEKVTEKYSSMPVKASTPETIKRVQSDLEKRLGPRKDKSLLDITEIQQVAQLVNEILEKSKQKEMSSADSHNTPAPPPPSLNSSKRGQAYESPQPPPQPRQRPPHQRMMIPRTDSIHSDEDNNHHGIYTIPSTSPPPLPSHHRNSNDPEKLVAVKISPYFTGKLVSKLLAAIQVALILLFAIFTSYDDQNVRAISRAYLESRRPTKRPLYDKNFYLNQNHYDSNERPTYTSNNNYAGNGINENEEGSGGSGRYDSGSGPKYQAVTIMPSFGGEVQNLHQFYYCK